MRWWLAYSHFHDWPVRELLRLGWEPFGCDANGIVLLRKQAETMPLETAERRAMIPGQ